MFIEYSGLGKQTKIPYLNLQDQKIYLWKSKFFLSKDRFFINTEHQFCQLNKYVCTCNANGKLYQTKMMSSKKLKIILNDIKTN